MAKKDKNSLLNIHYSRTMTSDNLSKAANYVGKYVLKGLGAFGKIMTAPFVQQGPTSATIYKSKELLAKERTIENKSEELLGKAMTWVSPLNYGAALATSNGLNARKGEEEVASWSPAWLAVGRLGELYVGPKAVKGVKSAPKAVVNTAAKAGVKPAKAAVVAREIKLVAKNKPKYTRVPSKNLFRTQVYKGGEITDPYSNFVTTDSLYAANYGKVTPYIFESRSVAKAKEPMMGSSDPVTMDMFIYNNTKRNPNATAIIGHDAITGEFTPSKGTEILNMNPKNLYPIRTSDSPTSLAFFERKPSKSVTREYVQSPKDITSDVGDLIAEGSERSVYASKSNPNIVYKIEDGNAPLEDINNIKIRTELTDDIIAPETTIGYFKHKNGKYYRVTQLDKYKSFNPDNYDADLSPELNLEIINTLEKAGWKVNIKNGLAATASKNGVTIGNLEHFNWGRDSKGNLKLIDLYVAERNPSKTSSTIQISPEELYKVLKDQELNGYYFMGHGTGRTGVNPQTIFDNGLRVKGGDIGNTTMPISESNLTSWPHMNSEEIIIMPGKATMTKYDSAHGHIPSDWYSSDVFHWTDNPKKVGSGPFAAFEPNASFTEQTIGGVPGVYTKPEAVLGSYNTRTHTLKLNPKSLYEFLFNVPKLTEPLTSLKFFERKPSKNNIVGASLDYSMKDSKGMDFIKQFFALLKINGKEYTLEGLKDAKNVRQGLPEYIQSYLNLNTVERAVRAMRKNGYSEREILLYVDKVNEEMNKVKVGMYSDLEYNAAGALDFGGFYNSDTNFISINKDALLTKPAFTPNYIMKHEGRHLIDYNTSMTDDVINILEKAYDKDFLEIPKHEDAGNLKDYLYMDRERVTTNRDAREVFLSNLEKRPGEFLNLTKFAQTSLGKYKDMVDFLNELILYAEPEDIINAVKNSNGYGKRYINYLKKNNKLTSTKIEQLRLAMIHVPSYLLPMAGGYTLYNIFNQPLQQLQYLKQGGKMNVLEFLKNGGQVRKMLTAAGGPLINESTRVEKPIVIPKKINKYQLSDDNLWEKTDNSEVHVYPNLRNDRYIQEFFLYDYAPRFKRLNNFASQDYVNAALNIYKNTPINVFNADSNIGGYKTGGERNNYNNFISRLINSSYIPPSIYLNGNFKMNRPTLVHELTHAFRLGHLGITGDARFSSAKRPLYSAINKEIGTGYFGSGYSNSEKNILDNTYNMKGFKMNYDPLWEKGTTNTEVRFRLWKELYDQLGRRPSLEETDKYIKTYDGEKLLRIIKNANAYGQTMYNNGMLINLIKNALINVAQNNSNNAYLLDDQTYYAKQGGKMNTLEFLKNGSGIHIKEKNKGKFTSYCGGKVTDECILKGKNSSNPAIRKRATFAANARKWKHKDGGILKAQLGLGLTLFNDSENPNAVGGDIVNSYIRNQLMIPYLLALKEDYEKWKLQMKLQANTLKSSLFDNLLNAGLSIGTDYLKSKLGI